MPATTSTWGHADFSSSHRLDGGVGVPVRDVEDERVDLGLDEGFGALEVVTADPDRGRDPQPALVVACGAGVAVGQCEVAERDQALDEVVCVDERQLLDPVRCQQAPGLSEVDPGRGGDEPFARCHQRVHAMGIRRLRAGRAP